MLTHRRSGLLAAGFFAFVCGVFGVCGLGGCSRSPKDADPAQSTDAGLDAEPLAPTGSAAAPAAPESPSPDIKAPEIKPSEGAPAPPQGYVIMKVADVVPTSQGNAVLLTDEAEERMLPIFVGGTEALSIQLRLDAKRYERPLTHDLLDNLVGKLGGDLVKVQVDEIRGSVFVGSVFVRQAGKIISVDARPSDAIALALGRRAPIFVASKVMDASSVKKRDLMRDAEEPERFHLPKAPPDPLHL
jgi:bifunctional DNase/RNase